ncbi:hypothetical protein SDC9_69881 [bioreactor metagenome]|uniref:Uncharacterized protein n=1 Tax=bioreactor metagenome TaxID=1076179 RepID=A0A644Y522_9ZZZZ
MSFKRMAAVDRANRADARFSRRLGFMGRFHTDIFLFNLADLPVGFQRRCRKNRVGELGGRLGLVNFLKIQARFRLGFCLVKNTLLS